MEAATATVVRDASADAINALKTEYRAHMLASGRTVDTFKSVCRAWLARNGMQPTPHAWAHAAKRVQFVHLLCEGGGCKACGGRGWHSGLYPLAG